MPRILFSALLKPFKGGIKGEIAELPGVEAMSTNFHGVVASLQTQIRERLRRLNLRRNCSGVPVTPAPKRGAHDDLVLPIEADIPDKRD